MKILQLIYESYESPFGYGGAGVRAYKIFGRLEARHDVTFLCMKYPGAKDREINGLKHIFVGSESKRLTKNVLSYTVKAAEYVRKFGDNFDIIIENFLPATPFCTKFLTKTPVILQIQGLWGLHHVRKFNVLYGLPFCLLEKLYPKFYDTFILVTDINMGKLIKRSKKCAVIPNGTDRDLLRIPSEEGDYILFFSRIDIYQKGLDTLIKAFGLVAEKFKDLRLVLAGYASSSIDDLMKLIPPGLRNRVSYAGFVSGEKKLRLLSKAKVLILPSRIEAHPVSLLEALACGKAVLVSGIPELKYIEENEIGVTFQRGSSRDLADKLSVLLENKSIRLTIGEKGRKFAANYLWDDIALKFEVFLNKVVSEKA